MPVRCAKCGEELLGAVNRCWQCGSPVASRGDSGNDPPIRRGPPGKMPPILEAAVVQPASSTADGSSDPGGVRIGSPFAPAAALHRASPPPSDRPEPPLDRAASKTSYPRHTAASGGAIAALVLGLLAVIFLWTPVASLAVAGLGIAAGVWGLYSERRAVAMAGIFLCCTALAIAGFAGVVGLYERLYGVNPWDELRGGLEAPLD